MGVANYMYFFLLLVVCKDRDIDLVEVQSFELASIPLAFAKMGGFLRKPTLLQELVMKSLANKSTLPAQSSSTEHS